MEPKGSWPHSQESVTCSYPEPDKFLVFNSMFFFEGLQCFNVNMLLQDLIVFCFIISSCVTEEPLSPDRYDGRLSERAYPNQGIKYLWSEHLIAWQGCTYLFVFSPGCTLDWRRRMWCRFADRCTHCNKEKPEVNKYCLPAPETWNLKLATSLLSSDVSGHTDTRPQYASTLLGKPNLLYQVACLVTQWSRCVVSKQ